jgi:hypothetical protein
MFKGIMELGMFLFLIALGCAFPGFWLLAIGIILIKILKWI